MNIEKIEIFLKRPLEEEEREGEQKCEQGDDEKKRRVIFGRERGG